MGADEKLAFIIMLSGFIGFPLICFIFYIWSAYWEDEVARACRKANKKYYQWEQSQKKKRNKS